MVQKEVEIENYGGVFEMRDFEGFFSEVLNVSIDTIFQIFSIQFILS